MKTSPIRPPKFQHCLTIHSWQFKACQKNLYAALLIAYLEEKFYLLLHSENKNKGWMKLSSFQIRAGIFTDSQSDVNQAFDILEQLKFIQLNPNSKDFPRAENEIWVKLNALEINRWIDMDMKPDEVKMGLLDFNPFLLMMLIEQSQEEPAIEKSILKKYEGTSKIQTARNLFAFYKWVNDKPRSQPDDKWLRLICDRLDNGYSKSDVALGCFGMLQRKQTDLSKYDGMKYIVGDSEKLDRMISHAESIGISLSQAEMEYTHFLNLTSKGVVVPKRETTVNSQKTSNGRELK